MDASCRLIIGVHGWVQRAGSAMGRKERMLMCWCLIPSLLYLPSCLCFCADVCSIDKLGHMQITDRSKDVVKSGGIYPNRGGGRGIILAPANSGWVLAGSVRGRLGACLPSSSHIPNPYTQELVAASASTTAVLTPLAACMHVHSQAASGSARLRLRTLPWGTPRWQRQPSLPSRMPSERKCEGGT